RTIPPARAAEIAGGPHPALDAGGRRLLPRHRLSAARRRDDLLPRLSDLRHRAVGAGAAGAGRLAAMDGDPDRLWRRIDRVAPVGADHQLARHDRARRQPLVFAAVADHAKPARHARPRDGDLAIRPHLRALLTDAAAPLIYARSLHSALPLSTTAAAPSPRSSATP